MTFDDWLTTDPADLRDDRDDNRDDDRDDRDDVPEYLDEPAEAPAQTTPREQGDRPMTNQTIYGGPGPVERKWIKEVRRG